MDLNTNNLEFEIQRLKVEIRRLIDENVKLKIENKNLQEKSDFFDALEARGVDNWEGYSDALLFIEEN